MLSQLCLLRRLSEVLSVPRRLWPASYCITSGQFRTFGDSAWSPAPPSNQVLVTVTSFRFEFGYVAVRSSDLPHNGGRSRATSTTSTIDDDLSCAASCTTAATLAASRVASAPRATAFHSTADRQSALAFVVIASNSAAWRLRQLETFGGDRRTSRHMPQLSDDGNNRRL
jgi:hypothetical protein